VSLLREMNKVVARERSTPAGSTIAEAMSPRYSKLGNKSPGKSNIEVNETMGVAGKVGTALTVVGIGISVANVALASPGERGSVAAEEVGGWAGAIAFGEAGAGNGGLIGFAIGGPPGAAIGAAIGGLGGSIVAAFIGRDVGRSAYQEWR
jgi:hypothetical protein